MCTSRTCDDLWVYVEGVIGWINAPFLVVLLAEGEGAAVHAHVVHVRVAAHRGLGQGQVLCTVCGGGGRTKVFNRESFFLFK